VEVFVKALRRRENTALTVEELAAVAITDENLGTASEPEPSSEARQIEG